MPTKTLYVGIDVSLKTNQVCSINFNQDVFFNLRFENSPKGCEELVIKLLSVLEEHQELIKVMICMETTNVYHIHSSSLLASDPRLQPFGTKVFIENAKSIENYKRTFVDREKTDPEDAFLCADYIRVGKCKNSHPVIGYQKIALQRLTRQRRHIAELLGKEKQYLSSNLYLKFSALKVNPNDKPFSNTFSKTASDMLSECLTTEEIANAPIEDLVIKIIELSKNKFDNPELVAKMFQKVSRDSYHLDKVSSDSVSISMASSFRIIRAYEEELKTLDKEILRLIDGNKNNHYQILTSIKGIGKVYAAGIIAEISDINLFLSDDKLAAYAGLRWKRKQSGEKDSEHKKKTNTGNAYLRYYLVEAAGSVVRYNDEYSVYYYKKYNEVKNNRHKRALVLTARKLVRLIYGMLRHNKLYDPAYQSSIS